MRRNNRSYVEKRSENYYLLKDVLWSHLSGRSRDESLKIRMVLGVDRVRNSRLLHYVDSVIHSLCIGVT